MHTQVAGQEALAPVFLFGFERSGTTLLSMMVGAHPRIAVPFSVTGLWYRYERMLDKYNWLRTMTDLERLIDDLLQEERICLWDIKLDRNAVLNGLRPGSYAEVIRRFHLLYARQKGKDLWGNIDIATLEHMDIANRWFPECKFVHIVRDGRDVALSHETYPYGASNLAECAENWLHQLRVNMKMGSIVGPERYLIIRYEDLVLETEAALVRLCDFIGVNYSKEMLEYHIAVKDKVPGSKRWLWPALDKPPVKENAYRWKVDMKETKRIVFEWTAGKMLKELGYDTYLVVPKRPLAYLFDIWCFLGKGHRLTRLWSRIPIPRKSIPWVGFDRENSLKHRTKETRGLIGKPSSPK